MITFPALDDSRPEAMDRLIGQAQSDADLTKSACDDPNREVCRMIQRLMTELPAMPAIGAVWDRPTTSYQKG